MRVAFRPVLASASVAFATVAHAGNFAASLEAGTERDAHDFSHAVLNYDNATAVWNSDSGAQVIGFLQSSRPRGTSSVWLVEGMAGHRFVLSDSFSFYASGGFGERMSAERRFAYVTVRGGVDEAFGEHFVWNVVNLRYRNGLDADFTYRSSVAGTGITWRLNDELALYTRVFAAFDTEFHFAGTGFGVGARKYF